MTSAPDALTRAASAPDRSTLAKQKAELRLLFLAYGTAIADGRRRDAHAYRAKFAALLDGVAR